MRRIILFVLFALVLVTNGCKSTKHLQTIKVDSTGVTTNKTELIGEAKTTDRSYFIDTTKIDEATVITILELDSSVVIPVTYHSFFDSLNLPVKKITRIEKGKKTQSGISKEVNRVLETKVNFKSSAKQKTELDKKVKIVNSSSNQFWVKLSLWLLLFAGLGLSILFIRFKS